MLFGGRLDGETRTAPEPLPEFILAPAYDPKELAMLTAELNAEPIDMLRYDLSERTIGGCAVYILNPKGAPR